MSSRVIAVAASLLAACCGSAGTPPASVAGAGGGGQSGGRGAESGGASGSGSSAGGGSAGGAAGSSGRAPNVLVFSRTLGYRHLSIAVGISAVQTLGKARGWQVTATEAPEIFSDDGLRGFNVLVFLNTTGDVLDDAQQGAMQRFIEGGNGYVGVHAASDTEYDWAFYQGLVGAAFRAHPAIQAASIVVEDAQHPATVSLPSPWAREDEWYAFKSNPRADVRVLLRLDEASYAPGDAGMGVDHPIAWCREYDGGRAFYTALGHTDASYAEPAFLEHLAGAIEWSARATP